MKHPGFDDCSDPGALHVETDVQFGQSGFHDSLNSATDLPLVVDDDQFLSIPILLRTSDGQVRTTSTERQLWPKSFVRCEFCSVVVVRRGKE